MGTLILASASPRRAELLDQIGVPYRCQPVDIDETPLANEQPIEYVRRLALAKARCCVDRLNIVFDNDSAKQNSPNQVVLGSDTTVVIDGQILGKPDSESHYHAMLKQLSGRTHQVMTAIAVVANEQHYVSTVITDVTFKPLSDDEIYRYWQTGEPQDKAGGYGIQGLAAVFVREIRGSYSAVVGLPLMETAALLNKAGIHVWQAS